jgi:single-strand DNA-binding protein
VNFNHVVLVGNLTSDPELRNISSGASVCEFSLAVNRKWTDKGSGERREEASFFDCVAWGKPGEIIAEYMRKGRALLVSGSLRQERWEDKQTGQKRSRVRVVVDTFQFLGGRRDEEEAPAQQNESTDSF